MSCENGVLLVQALYPFTGKNNDELCFKKGDLIVVTQKEDGGWWEGTYNDNTGWFPSNYVKEHKAIDGGPISSAGGGVTPITDIDSPPLSPQQTQQQVVYRTVVSKEIIESEKAHVAELKSTYAKYLTPLMASDILTEVEFKQLSGNLEELIMVHSTLLSLIEGQLELPPKEQRIGGAFLKIAPTLQAAHKAYIANHPKAVCIIEKYKEELNSFMEAMGATRPGTLVLTTALSQPFRRLDKYPGALQEFHRHIEESHPDRGDTQRSTHVFRELTSACGSIRRQKQLELEVLTNKVHGWEGGDSLSVLGDIVHMRSVALLPDNRDRYLVLFPSCLVVLALSSRASSFIFEGKYSLGTVSVNKLEDGSRYKNAFEITGNYMNQIIAVCQSPADQQQWVEILQQQIQTSKNSTPGGQKSSSPYCSPPAPPAHCPPPNRPVLCTGRPYALLTKYFAQFYRRKVITKELLRSLVGITLHGPVSSGGSVVLRTHRSECSIWVSNDAGLKDSFETRPPIRRLQREECDIGLMSPRLRRKEYKVLDKGRNRSNLQKWKFRPLLLDEAGTAGPDVPGFSRLSSSTSSDSESDHYGYIHYFKGSDSTSDCEWSSPDRDTPVTPPGSSDADNGWQGLECGQRPLTFSINLESKRDLIHASSFRSLPPPSVFEKGSSYEHKEWSPPPPRVTSTLQIPAHSVVIPRIDVDDDSWSSPPNICNRTIYGSSSEELVSASLMGGSYSELTPLDATQPSAQMPVACYYSSCSVDEMPPSCDFYASQRRHAPTLAPLSRSEPNLHHPMIRCLQPKVQTPRYESHLVRVLKRIEAPMKECCNCESHSRRSSDSGLADVTPHHCDGCPLRGDTALALGRASPSHRFSRSSLRIGRHRSSSFIRMTTPLEFSQERDSLFLTPTPNSTPCTSASLSCVSDSSVSLLEVSTVSAVAPSTTGIYRSGLYAHWWMKASVGLRPLKGMRPLSILSDIAERPEFPSSSFPLKPSCHPIRSSRYNESPAVKIPPLFTIPTIERSDEDQQEVEVLVPGDDRCGEASPGSRLQLEDATLCRDPSFESQASQATVIRRTEIRLADFGRPSKLELDGSPSEHLLSLTSRRESDAPLSDISSMHSFYESEEGAGESSLWRDTTDGLLLDYHGKSSFQSDLGSHPSHCCSFGQSMVHSSANAKEHVPPLAPLAFAHEHLSKSKRGLHNAASPCDASAPAVLHRSKSLPKSLALDSSKGSPLPLPHHNTSGVQQNNGKVINKLWSLSCLRPSPPLRPGFSIRDDKRNLNKLRRKDDSWHEEDALVLRVIEHYCTSAKTRYTVNSSLIDNPQMIIATEEKIIVEETRGNQVVIEEKSLVDTVYALKDQLASMTQNYHDLKTEFECERKQMQSLRKLIDQWLPLIRELKASTNL